ncbi:MAG: HD domain-containing protein [Gemmatimonas sp.]
MSTLERAIVIAAEAHAGQQDKAGESYILHPLRVMQRVSTNDARIVAVLHDVVEDTPWTLQQLSAEGFSSAIVDAVDALTRREHESYDAFVIRAGKNAIARSVKLADLADNMELTRIKEPGAKDFERMERYKRAVAMLS